MRKNVKVHKLKDPSKPANTESIGHPLKNNSHKLHTVTFFLETKFTTTNFRKKGTQSQNSSTLQEIINHSSVINFITKLQKIEIKIQIGA